MIGFKKTNKRFGFTHIFLIRSFLSVSGFEKERSVNRGAACDWSELEVSETLHRIPGSARTGASEIALDL